MKGYCDTLKEYKQHGNLAFLAPWAQLIENVRGKAPDPRVLKGSYMDEEVVAREFQQDQSVKNRSVVLMVHNVRLILLYLCQDYERAEKDRQKHEKLPPATASTYIFNLTQAIFTALNCYAQAIATGRKKFISIGRPHVALVESFGKAGSPNIPPLLALLEAEVLTFRGKYDKAVIMYQDAINGFQGLEFHLFEAIAYERMGLSLAGKDPERSRTALKQAWRKYSDLGATVKLSLMEQNHGDGLSSSTASASGKEERITG